MAQGNNYGQTSNGVADESPNMLVYRKVRISSLSWKKGKLLTSLLPPPQVKVYVNFLAWWIPQITHDCTLYVRTI